MATFSTIAGCVSYSETANWVEMEDWSDKFSAGQERYPRWSPNGLNIVFISNAAGEADLFVYTIAQKQIRRLPTQGGGSHADWIDDNSIIFDSARDDSDPDIYVLDLLNGAVEELVDSPGWDGTPTASADGAFITYYSERTGNADLRKINRETREDIAVTSTAHKEQYSSWSQSGRWLVYQTTQNGNRDVAVRDERNATTHILTTDPARDHFPRWINEDEIIFASNRSGEHKLYRVGRDGASERLMDVGINDGEFLMPDANPDGLMFVFVRADASGQRLFIYDEANHRTWPLFE